MVQRCVAAAVVVLVVGAAQAAAQCFSPNDSSKATPELDLSHASEFGLQLFREVFPYNATDSNFFFSPYSVWSALTLAYFGSGGNTEAELQEVLGHPDKVTALNNWLATEYMYDLRHQKKVSYTFNMANRAYFDRTVELRPCITEHLPAQVQVADFSQPEVAAKDINQFVWNTTKGRIPELVRPGDVAKARMVLANAAFFKGKWLSQFKPDKTAKLPFYSTAEDYTFVDMMTQKGQFRYGASEELGAYLLELPYVGQTISMYILLPPFISGSQGFNTMVERLNASLLQHAFSSMWPIEVEVTLPKFKLEQTVENELVQAVSRMGINDLFNPATADLSTFSAVGGLSVGKSIHKAYVEVSEEGTEAAAATVLVSWRIARPLGPTKFNCNYPFLFVIYDNENNNILFMGAYKDPKA